MNYFRVVGVGFFLAILLILAGTNDVRSQQREAVDTKQLRQEAVHIMLQALDNTDLSTRLTVLSDLKEVRVPEALPVLVNLIKDQKYRREAIDALGNQVPDPVVIQLISQYMASERSPFTRRQAVLALERLAERQAIPALIKTLLRDPERFVSAEAARVLGIFKDSTALPALMKTLDEALQLHKEALEKARNPPPQPGFGLNFYPVTFLPNVVGALLAFKEQTAIPAFIELIKAQAPSFGGTLVPFYSGLAFFPILVSSKDEVFNSILKEALRPLLSDPNPAIRLRTALTLMYWGDAAAMSAVAALLEQAKTASLILRQLIVFEFFALTTRGIDLDDALFPAISDLIDSLAGPTPPNDDQFARETARTFLIYTLGYIGSERAVRKILEIADQVSHACPELNPLYVPRYATLIALTAAAAPSTQRISRNELVMPALISFAQDPCPYYRSQAALVLGYLGNPVARPVLLDLLEDHAIPDPLESKEVRDWAIEALGRLGDPNVLRVLAAFLADPKMRIRIHAASAILKILNKQH